MPDSQGPRTPEEPRGSVATASRRRGVYRHQLELDGSSLADALRLLGEASAADGAWGLRLRYDGGELSADLGGAAVAVPATGTWPDVVWLGPDTLEELHSAARPGALTLGLTGDGRLELDGATFECEAPAKRLVRAAEEARRAAAMQTFTDGDTTEWPGEHRNEDGATDPPPIRFAPERAGGMLQTRARALAARVVSESPRIAARESARIARASVRIARKLKTAHWRFPRPTRSSGGSAVSKPDLDSAFAAVPRRPLITGRQSVWLIAAGAAAVLLYLGARSLVVVGPVYDTAVRFGIQLSEPHATRRGADTYMVGDVYAAVAQLTDAAARYRRSAAAPVHLAGIFTDHGDTGTAGVMLDDALAREPANREVVLEGGVHHFLEGVRHEGAGKHDLASVAFQRAAEIFAALADSDPVVAAWHRCTLLRLPDADPATVGDAAVPGETWASCRPGAP